MGGLRIYRAPSGLCFQYEEGRQPRGYELAAPGKPKAAPKRRATANKAKQADDK